jgi:putative IMPACT (imprinted ancient) family translation regulator
MKPDTYKTIATPTTGEFKDRGSKFIAYSSPLSIETDFPIFLENIGKFQTPLNKKGTLIGKKEL